MKKITCLFITSLFIYLNNYSYAEKKVNINNDNIYSSKELLLKGDKALQEKEIDKAIYYYSKYLKINKNDIKVKEKYKQVILKNRLSIEKNINVKTSVSINNKISIYISPISNELMEKPQSQIVSSEDYKIDKKHYIDLSKNTIIKWSNVYKNISFSFVDNKNDADIIVNWYKNYITVDHWDIESKPRFYEEKNKFLSFINIALSPHPKHKLYENFAYSDSELENIIFHLAGHAIGIDHNHKLMQKSLLLTNKDFNNENNKLFFQNFPRQNTDITENSIIEKYDYLDVTTNKEDDYLCFVDDKDWIILHSDGRSFLRKYMRWDKKDFPLKVHIPKPNQYNVDADYFYTMTMNAFKRWSDRIPEIIKFNYVDKPDKADIIVKWSDFFEHKNYWGLAQSVPYQDNHNRKKACYISLAVKAQPGWYSEKPIFFGEETFINIATHEMGHALGLDHGPDENGATGRGALITERDVNTLRRLYSVPLNKQFLCSL